MLRRFKTESQHLAVVHLGIIVALAQRYWRSLPPHVVSSYGLEDLIGDLVVAVTRAVPRYDPQRGRSSTFVWRVAQNECNNIVARHREKRQIPSQISLEDTTYQPSSTADWRWLEAKSAIESVVAHAPDDVRRLLAQLIEGGKLPLAWRIDRKLLTEVTRLCRIHHANYSDFKILLSRT